ncbi:hypothetical protein [Methylobacterium ajmalii]|uniref:hypothetical protein n=1 Tax=Methylobacterium ajmalii TaxID=2738439 RepID=UPI002F35DD38
MVRMIGLSGFAGSGKTAAAIYIESMFGYQRRHIAEPFRAMLAVLLRANGVPADMIGRYLTGDLKDGVIIPEIGCTSRHLQITMGNDWGRGCVHPDLWVNTLDAMTEDEDKVQNDSVRYPNEEALVHRRGGFTILIERPGTGPAAFKWGRFGRILHSWFGCMWGVHDSERVDRLNPDVRIVNDGTLQDLYDQLDEVMRVRVFGLPPAGNDNAGPDDLPEVELPRPPFDPVFGLQMIALSGRQ